MPLLQDLIKIRSIADYQFGKGIGTKFFSDNVRIVYSKRTRKIRYIYLGDVLLATLRPTTGLFILTLDGAKHMINNVYPLRLWVKIENFAEPFVSKGRSVFAKHVTDADMEIRPREEVIILNQQNEVLAVGWALLSGSEMKAFSKGIAVKIRHGVTEKS
jgi:7-cyano-7-deazaguanine tRNA-ribosyltransferase